MVIMILLGQRQKVPRTNKDSMMTERVHFMLRSIGSVAAMGVFLFVGTAGYGDDDWAIGQSYADDPVLTPVIYDPDAPAGQRFSSDGLQASEVPRMYHSSATLLRFSSITTAYRRTSSKCSTSHFTVTLFARFLGISGSLPRRSAKEYARS